MTARAAAFRFDASAAAQNGPWRAAAIK